MNLTLKQQKANRKKWVKALRSGKYQQGKGQLYHPRDDTYCCLGVLCAVAGAEYEFEHESAIYPPQLKDFVGFRTLAANITGDGYCSGKTLADINDKGTPFSEIADIIESEPPGLFTA